MLTTSGSEARASSADASTSMARKGMYLNLLTDERLWLLIRTIRACWTRSTRPTMAARAAASLKLLAAEASEPPSDLNPTMTLTRPSA